MFLSPEAKTARCRELMSGMQQGQPLPEQARAWGSDEPSFMARIQADADRRIAEATESIIHRENELYAAEQGWK